MELSEASGVKPLEGLTPPELDQDLNFLRWTTYVAVGGGFIILYGGLVSIVWRGWRTIKAQQLALLDTNADLGAAYHDLKDTQERLVRAERLAAIGELAAGVAHDLRNPLGAIKNAVYYVKDKVRDTELLAQNPRVGEFLDIVDEGIEISTQVLEDLTEFARVNPPNRSPTELNVVVENSLVRAKLKDSVHVVKQLEPELPAMNADSEQLRRAFDNLLSNADDAMPEGGTLTITGRAVDGSVEVQFADTGEGISDANLGKVLEPLFTTKPKGIGLGLAIVTMIVERHQGTIKVDSSQGEGTTFTLRLPIGSSDGK